jgi:hypothetical protein
MCVAPPRYQHVGSNPYDAPDAEAPFLVGGDL